MKFRTTTLVIALVAACSLAASAQVRMHGRVFGERSPGSGETMAFSNIMCFAAPEGSMCEPLQFSTFETDPVAWYNMEGASGRYTMLFSNPAHYMRPIVLTNIYAKDGDDLYRIVGPSLDLGVFRDGEWDPKPAKSYYQTFTAKGTSVTQVGFKLANDGVDGFGPESQDFLISIHRKASGTPDKWPQVGPAAVVLNVDCGGEKGYSYSAGWDSGEVVLTPGETYTVHLRPKDPNGTFQTFWSASDGKSTDCYRVGAENTGWQGRNLYMAVSTDCDGLLIPYNKRVHRKFDQFAGGASKWTQTYVAQGRSLASVILYSAVSGAQPPLTRQRMKVRVRQGGPNGALVGIEKIAVGQGNWTGDASWGAFGAVYAPGEVPLEPGKTYAIEFESIETMHTIGDFVNIKGDVSDGKAGFNPYRKADPDTYKRGTSYRGGKEAMNFDLDMQVIEYENDDPNWASAVDAKNLVRNGDMEMGDLSASDGSGGRPLFWRTFSTGARTGHLYLADELDGGNRLLRVTGISEGSDIVDGGYVQKVEGLSHLETYRLTGRVRSTYVADTNRQCYVGYDLTGQTDDPDASTIVWTTLPGIQGFYVPYESGPIRPAKDGTAISIWLRGRAVSTSPWPFRVDFDDLSLHRVNSGIPGSN